MNKAGRKPPAKTDFGLCCGLFILLWIMPLMFILFYNGAPAVVALAFCVCVICAVTPAFVSQRKFLAGGCLAGVLLSAAGGFHGYYAHVLPLITVAKFPRYYDVYPQESAIAYADAGAVSFAHGTIVDDMRAASMVDIGRGLFTYCVAPIMAPGDSTRANFWAVGVDCCSGRRFNCDDVGNLKNRTGYVVPNGERHSLFFRAIGKYMAPPMARRDLFEQAVKKAEAMYGIKSSKKPIFMRWKGESFEAFKDEQIEGSVVLLVVQALGAAVLAIGLAFMSGGGGQAQGPDMMSREAQDLIQHANSQGVQKKTPMKEHIKTAAVWGVLVPFVTLVGTVLICSFYRCARTYAGTGMTFWSTIVMDAFLLALAVMILASLAMPQRRIYGIFLLLVAGIGCYVGRLNYITNSSFACAAAMHREYANVPPDARAGAYQDAGKVHFERFTMVDTTRSLGLLSQGITYCAAPILQDFIPTNRLGTPPVGDEADVAAAPAAAAPAGAVAQKPVPKRAEFWAVGYDCCDARGNFHCDDAKDKDARAGVVMRDPGEHWLAIPPNAQFTKAVKAAAEHYGLPVPAAPMLMRWGKGEAGLEKIEDDWLKDAFGIVIVVGLVSFIVLAVLGVAVAFYLPRRRGG